MTQTFDVATDWRFPTLGRRVVPEGGRVEVASAHEAWDEYDTASGDLASAGVRLVRSADGWTLTTDEDALSFPGSGRAVPVEVRDLLLGVRAGAALRLVRRVDRERTVRAIRDADGVQLGEIADVREVVTTSGAAAMVTGRRVVEVSAWDGPFPAAAAKRLRRAGAVPAPTVETRPEPDTVGAAVRAELAAQRRAVLHGEVGLRRGEDVVHRTRVATRRLRSVLRIVTVADPEQTAALDAELRWLAGVLGAVRDAEVLRGHLRAAIERTPGLPAATVTLIERGLDDEHAAASAALTKVLAGRRYLAVLKTLRRWADDPPFTPDAGAPAARLERYVRRAERRLERRVRRASDDEDLHRARRAAKRLRYTADIVPGAEKIAKRAERIQERLGQHQDSVVAAEFLARLAAAPSASREAAFGCGVLWAREIRLARKSARLT